MSAPRTIAAVFTAAVISAAVAACSSDQPAPTDIVPHEDVLVPAAVSSLDSEAVDRRLAVLIRGDVPDETGDLEPLFANPTAPPDCLDQLSLTPEKVEAVLTGVGATETEAEEGCTTDRSVTIDPSGGASGGHARIQTTPSNGYVQIDVDGTVTYVPEASFVGLDSFAYEFTDADGRTTSTKVVIAVTDSMEDQDQR